MTRSGFSQVVRVARKYDLPGQDMLKTLYGYILKELLGTFFLATLGLTAVLSMGGGVLNIVKFDELSAQELVTLMVLVLPLAGTLTLPIALIFSCAATYGRLASDNEFLACRSGGLNIHRLLIPAFSVSIVVSLVTFMSINFWLPGIVQHLDRLVGKDIGAILKHRLQSPEAGLPGLGNYRIYHDEFAFKSTDEADLFVLKGVAFLELGDNGVNRVGTAKTLFLRLDQQENQTVVSGEMEGLRLFDHREMRGRQIFQEDHQIIQPNLIPHALPQKLKFQTLSQLLYYHRNPELWSDVLNEFEKLRILYCRCAIYDDVIQQFTESGSLKLTDGRRVLEVRTDVPPEPMAQGWITLRDVTVIERSGADQRELVADRANIEVSREGKLTELTVMLELLDNIEIRDGSDRQQSSLSKFTFPGLEPPMTTVQQIEGLTQNALLSPLEFSTEFSPLVRKQKQARELVGRTKRKIASVLHQRMSFTVSILLLGILAASLGVIYSQAHILTSVGISMAPTLALFVAILAGKQMSENVSTEFLGIGVIWGSVILLGLVDLFVVSWKLKR